MGTYNLVFKKNTSSEGVRGFESKLSCEGLAAHIDYQLSSTGKFVATVENTNHMSLTPKVFKETVTVYRQCVESFHVMEIK